MAENYSQNTCTPNLMSEANTVRESPTKVTIVENLFEEFSAAPGIKSQTTLKSNLPEGRDESKMCHIAGSTSTGIDVFDVLRPKEHSVKEYKIRQYDSKVEREVPCGVQKFHFHDTSVYVTPYPPGESYVPPPPPKKKHKKFQGVGPCNEFLEDIWKRKALEREQRFKNRLPRFIKNRKKEEAEAKVGMHKTLMKLIGPDWYQELSPFQLRTIDNLKLSLVKDFRFKTVENTVETLTALGIVPPPSRRLVKKAFKRSYICPVEFLLVFYQLMDKDREEYTLNDRLLLSAVVHLTIRDTLRELHIRIPSPPPPLPKPPKLKKKKQPKRIKYASPYLVPYTFKPEPRKHKGIYKNTYIQYPEHPYFSYIPDLSVKEFFDTSIVERGKDSKNPKILDEPQQIGISDELELEIIGEMRLAQYIYNKMTDNNEVPLLRKPTIYVPCEDPNKPRKPEPVPEEPQTNVSICVCVKVTTDFDECCKPVRRVCEYEVTSKETEGVRECCDPEPEVCVCDLGQDEEDAEEEEPPQPPPCVCGNLDDICGDESIYCFCGGEDEEEEEFEEEDLAIEEEEVPTCREQCPTREVCGIVDDGVICRCPLDEERPRDWLSGEQVVTAASRISFGCTCKAVVQKQIDERFCQCARCKADRGELRNSVDKSVGGEGGVEEANSDDKKKTCDCLEKYQERVKMYDDVKNRLDAQDELLSLQKQFIIGGVTYTREGKPIYTLIGTAPQKPMVYDISDCGPKLRSGVPTEVCKCDKVYDVYKDYHNPCMAAYQEYLHKIEMDTEEYLQELAEDKRYVCDCMVQEEEPEEEQINFVEVKEEHKDEHSKKSSIELQSQQSQQNEKKVCICGGNNASPLDDIEIETDLKLTLEINMDEVPDDYYEEEEYGEEEDGGEDTDESLYCICDPRFNPDGCVCGGRTDANFICDCGAEVEEEEEELLNIASSLKRYTLLEKIPCDYDEQMEILKKSLESLATDGFPLAKLPECYKLPIFKLWMQLRCGMFWTQEDRVPMLELSRGYWRHLDYCRVRKVDIPKLPFSKKKCREFTWKHAKFVKGLTSKLDTDFYRKLKQAVIGDGREFFPSTFSYELPTHNFRDCFFSYIPSRELDCLAYKPWKMHEVKPGKRKKC